MFLISLNLLIVSVILIHCAIRKTRAGILFDKIPGPKGVLILGNVFQFLVSPTELFYIGRRLFRTYKSINRIWLMHVRLVNIYDPDHIETLLSTSKYNEKQVPYTFMRPWLREGLLLSNGDKWHKRRKILTPAFHFNILKEFANIIEEKSAELVENLANEVGGEQTDIIPYITRATLSTICETSMGTTLGDELKNNLSSYFEAIHKLGKYVVYRIVRFWLYSDLIFSMTSVEKEQRNTLKYLHQFTMNVIQTRRKQRNCNGEEIAYDVEENQAKRKKKRMALLDLLLEAEEEGKIDEIGIREEVDTFMFEGHDTTAMALCFAIMLLANETQAQENIFEECLSIFGGSDRSATIEDLMKMKYLECCIKESLRLYPSVPYIARHIQEDMVLGEYTVPANTICNVLIFDLHRNGDIYESPLSFIPERFLPEYSAKRHPFAYIPFSAGPRNCIGQKFAMLELKSAISRIIRKYQLEAITTPADLVLTADIVLRTTHPIYVKLHAREKML